MFPASPPVRVAVMLIEVGVCDCVCDCGGVVGGWEVDAGVTVISRRTVARDTAFRRVQPMRCCFVMVVSG